MITTMSIDQCVPDKYDEMYLIVRSIDTLVKRKHPILEKSQQLDCLSPSQSLFYRYLNWRKTGMWNTETFNLTYKPQFINELKANSLARETLIRLIDKCNTGKNIALLCFCKDVNLCHRKIVGEILKAHCDVLIK